MNDPSWHPLVDGHPLPWADGWGQDRHGVFAEFVIGDVVQRLRWIPPGWFMMGSPEGEPGRWEAEGPRHEVRISRGFWLFDTPCTQALWQAVMGENPSRFKTPDRPMEQVSFEDVQEFLRRVEGIHPGLGLTLPSEAQWEYACRAGTTTAVYGGEMEIIGARNAPVLDAIAWYGGNSGVGFDLDNGEDSSDWPEKQYPHERAGTRPVGLKSHNPWGLCDMLGNVWEWCADVWHDSYEGAPVDGRSWVEEGNASQAVVERVIRGGSWSGSARGARSANRGGYHPSDRYSYLGFRCARVQE